MTGAFVWIMTWIIAIAFFVILAQSRWGQTIVYYALWLLVALLLVTHASELTSLVNIKALELNG